MFKIIITTILALSLSACGGGSSPDIAQQALQDVNKAAVEAVKHIPTPAVPAAFTGAFMAVNGVSIGYVAGATKEAIVSSVAQSIINSPTGANAEAYKLMLSDAGLKVVVYGESIGKSAINGMTLYAPDKHAVVKLRSDGMHIVFVS